MSVRERQALKVVIVVLVSILGAAGTDLDVAKALVALFKTVHFLNEELTDSSEIVPDILFGIVLALGQVRLLAIHLHENVCTVGLTNSEKYKLKNGLGELETRMMKVLRKHRGKVPEKDDETFNLLVDKMLDPKLWMIDRPMLAYSLPQFNGLMNFTLDEEEMRKLVYDGLPNEQMSDACLAEIFGVVGPYPCFASDACRKVELDLDPSRSTGYPLTHRLLYIQAARQANCQTFGPPKVLAGYSKYFCALILDEAQSIANMGFPEAMFDLFVEQVALCGMEGYTEFTNKEWFHKILSAQRPEGCFEFSEKDEKPKLNEFELTPVPARRKREDAELSNGCTMHLTGVASAAVATCLRALVECAHPVSE